MKRILLFLFILIILNSLSSVIATCGSGQIDINSASLEDLDKLSGIGPVKAQAIIDTRPFNSIDDLIDVMGIGNATLEKIKTQGLACVEGEEDVPEEEAAPEEEPEEEIPQEEENTAEEDIHKEEETKNTKEESVKEKEVTKKDISIDNKEITKITGEEIKTIVLSSLATKDIKTESDKEELNKNKLAIYGLIIFCILLAFLFGFKNRENEKNEFK